MIPWVMEKTDIIVWFEDKGRKKKRLLSHGRDHCQETKAF